MKDKKVTLNNFNPKKRPPDPGYRPAKPFKPYCDTTQAYPTKEVKNVLFELKTAGKKGVITRTNFGKIMQSLPKGTMLDDVQLEIEARAHMGYYSSAKYGYARLVNITIKPNPKYAAEIAAQEKIDRKYETELAEWKKKYPEWLKRKRIFTEWNRKKVLWDKTQVEKTQLGKLKVLAKELGISLED